MKVIEIMKTTAIVLCLSMAGCAAINVAFTPGFEVKTNPFDNAIHVIQAQVSSASSGSEEFHTLGFEWISDDPDRIYITIGRTDYRNITTAVFKADGEIISVDELANEVTIFKANPDALLAERRSFRRFIMPFEYSLN